MVVRLSSRPDHHGLRARASTRMGLRRQASARLVRVPRRASVPPNVLRAFHGALGSAGLPRQPFHHLRHAYVTFQLEGGEELAKVSKILGHADLGTTADLYAHLTPTIARRAADRMDAILAG